LIDVDSGNSLLHFKAVEKKDFTRIISLIEAATNTTLQLQETTSKTINSNSITSNAPSIDIKNQAEELIEIISTEAKNLTEIVEFLKSRSKTSSKDQSSLESTTAIQAAALNLKSLLTQFHTGSQLVLDHLAHTESILTECLLDNNRVRRQHLLEPITRDHFVNIISNRSRALSVSGGSEMFRSFSTAKDEMFYDAEQDLQDIPEDEFILETGIDSEDEDLQSSVPIVKIFCPTSSVSAFTRRKCLPSPTISMENISLLSILRINVGKDLSTVSMPLALNEPLNLLQKLCEELEYADLLDKANASKDPFERLLLVSAFAVSGYGSTVNRSGRKPFNPLLGETFEFNREDLGFRFVSEKVSHQPPVMACHADSPSYSFYQDSHVKPKFWGKSMELVPIGIVHVILKATGEHYSWGKVTTCMRNIFSTSRYLEHYGTMNVKNHTLGHTVQLQFRESGYFSSSKNEVVGNLYNSSGDKVCSLGGKWDESLTMFYDSSPDTLRVLWRAKPAPPNHAEMYGFSDFAVELNELTPDISILLPCTDTRFRPDQRMLEHGKIEEAEAEKLRLEQKQRECRKEMEMKGIEHKPRWFEIRASLHDDGGMSWQIKGDEYWTSREAKEWQGTLDIF